MPRSIIFPALLIIAGCSNPETEPLVPGNRCEIVEWAKSTKTAVRFAEFYDQGGPLTKLRPQTRVVVVQEKVLRRKRAGSIERVMVKVLTGPLEGHVGFVFRPHLRKKPGPIPQPEKAKEEPGPAPDPPVPS